MPGAGKKAEDNPTSRTEAKIARKEERTEREGVGEGNLSFIQFLHIRCAYWPALCDSYSIGTGSPGQAGSFPLRDVVSP